MMVMVQAKPRAILEYITSEGRNHFAEGFVSLRDMRTKARILARLARLREGNLGDCKPAGSGVMELRVDFGPGYRVYFGQEGDMIVILLCGGDKSSQARDIDLARSLWAAYRREKS
jgi:putative addiction module killer protein